LKKRRVVRAWSASKRFFINRPPAAKKKSDSDAQDQRPAESVDDYVEVAPGVFARDVPAERNESPTLGERVEKWARTVQITEEQADGSVRGYLRVTSTDSWGKFLAKVVQEKLTHFMGSSDLTVNEREIVCLRISNLPSGCLLYS
jgi:hypothetical protein